MAFSSHLSLSPIFSIDWNLLPRSGKFNLGTKKKSYGAIVGEYGACSGVFTWCWFKLFTPFRLGALYSCKIQEFSYLFCGRLRRTAYLNRQCSIFIYTFLKNSVIWNTIYNNQNRIDHLAFDQQLDLSNVKVTLFCVFQIEKKTYLQLKLWYFLIQIAKL